MTRDEIVDLVIGRILKAEGGVKDVGDGHGVTRFGQTPIWLEQYKLRAPEDTTQAAANYRAWLILTGLIAVCDSYPLALIVIDWAVMSTAERAIRGLQSKLGVRPDGVWGPVTEAALAARAADTTTLARLVLADSIRQAGATITALPERAKDAKGWMNRKAALLELVA